MKVTSKKISTTQYEVTYTADEAVLKIAKQHAINKLSKNVKIAGFREGKAPEHLVEKEKINVKLNPVMKWDSRS